MTHRIDLSIGPVQGFIAKSRRTRDLWGSSYLLAFLTAHAMRGVAKAGGEIVRPLVDRDPLYRWVRSDGTGDPPSMGSLPNHFVAEVTSPDPGAVAKSGVRAMQEGWRRVCDAVWDRFVADSVAHGNGTADIWRRQIEQFWEVAWTVEPSQGPKSHHRSNGLPFLARRKQWRSHRLPPEPGDKCTVMPDFQELSGFVRSVGRGIRQDKFWNRLRKRTGGPINLRDNERLCAIALVKRMFPLVSEMALGWKVDGAQWPSTVYMGAVPWIRETAAHAPDVAGDYAAKVKAAAPKTLGRPWMFTRLSNVDAVGDFPRLDANWLHEKYLRDTHACPLEGEDADEVRSELLRALRALHRSSGFSGTLGSPPSFYALLLADGDRLGGLLRELGPDGPNVVSRALAKFTSEVPSLVRQHDGMAVYAGGDDVLAMLPVESALECAVSLSEHYRQAFRSHSGAGTLPPRATLSAAVVFAHIRYPLGQVIEQAHRLLDEVAKDGNGRDSLAASVLKPSGLYCEWATTWRRPTRNSPVPSTNRSRASGEEGRIGAIDQLNKLVQHLRDAEDEPGISSGLLYRIRDTLSLVCGLDSWKPGTWGDPPEDLNLADFVRAEVFQSVSKREGADRELTGDDQDLDRLTGLIGSLLPRSRRLMSGQVNDGRQTEIGLDALLLARFLASFRDEGQAS